MNSSIKNTRRIVDIFVSFLRLGLTAFGGPAMVAYIRDLAVKKKDWLDQDSMHQGVAICQSIPGATAMQAAAYVGLRAGGPIGALASYIGFGLPAFFLMVALAALYGKAHHLPWVLSMFNGLQVVVVAMVANATVSFGRSSIRRWQDGLLAAGAAVILVGHGSPVWTIALSALLAIILYRDLQPSSIDDSIKASAKGLHPVPKAPFILTGLVALMLFSLYFLDKRLFDLAALMIKVDCFAFGGGYASVPLMLHEVVDVRHWIDYKTFMDGIALGQVTPGPIVITATFVGYLIAGLKGAIIGTVSIFSPSFIILLGVVPYFDRLQENYLVKRAIRGILASFVGLLFAVALHFSVVTTWSITKGIIGASAFLALHFGIDVLWVVLAGSGVSIILL